MSRHYAQCDTSIVKAALAPFRVAIFAHLCVFTDCVFICVCVYIRVFMCCLISKSASPQLYHLLIHSLSLTHPSASPSFTLFPVNLHFVYIRAFYSIPRSTKLSLSALPHPFLHTYSSCILNADYSINIDCEKAERRGMEGGRREGGCSLIDGTFWSVDLRSASCKGQVSAERVRLSVCVHVCP